MKIDDSKVAIGPYIRREVGAAEFSKIKNLMICIGRMDELSSISKRKLNSDWMTESLKKSNQKNVLYKFLFDKNYNSDGLHWWNIIRSSQKDENNIR